MINRRQHFISWALWFLPGFVATSRGLADAFNEDTGVKHKVTTGEAAHWLKRNKHFESHWDESDEYDHSVLYWYIRDQPGFDPATRVGIIPHRGGSIFKPVYRKVYD